MDYYLYISENIEIMIRNTNISKEYRPLIIHLFRPDANKKATNQKHVNTSDSLEGFYIFLVLHPEAQSFVLLCKTSCLNIVG